MVDGYGTVVVCVIMRARLPHPYNHPVIVAVALYGQQLLGLKRRMCLRKLGTFHIDERRSLTELRAILREKLSEGLARATTASIAEAVVAAEEAKVAAAAAAVAAAACERRAQSFFCSRRFCCFWP